MSTDAPENPRETENEEPDENADANAENETKADDQNDQPEAGAEENEKPKKGEGDDKDKEEKIPSEPEMTEEEKKDLEDRTKEQKAADRRNLKRDRKCNCSRASCKMCCKRTWTAIAFILLMLLITGSFFAIMFIILLNLLKMGNQLMVQDILYMEGPAGTVVSPTLHCKINGSNEHRCKRYPLGGVAAKCDCNQQIMTQDLWLELRNQRVYAESLKPQSFNRSTNDYQTAKDNIYNMISNCTNNVSLDNPYGVTQQISNNQHCFLIGFNNIINWVPEAEMRFDVYPVQQAYNIISRTYVEDPKQAILDWTDIVSKRMNKGESMERAVYFANTVFNITWEKEFEALNKEVENSLKEIKCSTHQNHSNTDKHLTKPMRESM
ncbi:uncharacterized protein LOC142348452 isoform X2 [Convolutriloba macropyga]|uniref:uncharacterized protein LOC142348452 isoform X2 n=1 Tax=Convolutriloba macropyga TaxID=536237 RepID=UPI003F51E780